MGINIDQIEFGVWSYMIDKVTLNAIGNASTKNEQKILCDLYGIAYDVFQQIWPYEQLGQIILNGDVIIESINRNISNLCQDNHAYVKYDIVIYIESKYNLVYNMRQIQILKDLLVEIPSLYEAVEKFYKMYNRRQIMDIL